MEVRERKTPRSQAIPPIRSVTNRAIVIEQYHEVTARGRGN